MDQTPVDVTAIDLEFPFPVDQFPDLSTLDAVTSADTAAITGGADTADIGIGTIAGLGAGALLATSLSQYIGDAIKALSRVLSTIDTAIGDGLAHNPLTSLTDFLGFTSAWPKLLQMPTFDASTTPGAWWKWVQDVGIKGFVVDVFSEAMGLDRSKLQADAGRSLDTVDSMVGFSIMAAAAAAATGLIGKILMGERWAESSFNIMGELPEELGLNFAIGNILSRMFELATGAELDEAIAVQKRPNRIGWPQLRTLFKQHLLHDVKDEHGNTVTLEDLLARQGFPDWQIQLLKQLEDAQLPVADIAQLYNRELIDEARVGELIDELGFGPEKTAWLRDLYVVKAETEASVLYRSVARQAFENDYWTEDQFKDALKAANFASRQIDQDVAAIKIGKQEKLYLAEIGNIKTQYLTGHSDGQAVTQELTALGVSPARITELLTIWQYPPLRRTHGLSQAKIMSYLVSGVLTPDQARTLLQGTGLDAPSIDLLLAHPSTAKGARVYKLTPSLVKRAYIDGAIPPDQLGAAFTSVGVSADALNAYIIDAQEAAATKKGSPYATVELSKGDIEGAFKAGLLTPEQAEGLLTHMGYTADNALLIVETWNKGPIVAASSPAFTNLDDAIGYLISQGFSVYGPPDPLIGAAEAILTAASYTFSHPYVAPVPIGTGTGGGPVH